MKFHSLKDIENKVPKPGSFKHFLRIQEHGGRVVKGVNTTADVGVDAIKKQAAKFGNKVDKDGRPPTLSKKVKGSKTNVLFNLGMTESVDKADESVLYYAKMAENLGELASTSKVYVDMDGVLADFFGEWQKLIGKDWRKVKDIEPALQKIRDKDNFWLDLPLLPQAKNLLGVIKKVKGSYTILSSPLPNDPNSEPHKREWIKKNLDFFPPENVIITHDKPKYAVNSDGTPNILIDDFGKNIASWEAAGGEGFKHKDHKFERTAKAIQQHMQEPVKEGAEITMWTNPEYQGADVDDKYYKKQPVKIVDVSKLTPFEPADKMDPKDNHDNMMRFVDKIKAGKKIKPIVIVPHKGKLLIVDGHHRYFAHLKAGVDKVRAVVADPKDVTWRDDVPESVQERTLTKGEEKKKEKNVKGMKKNKGDFKKRYGKDADAVMYATATKMAKEALISGLYTTDQVLDLLENFADGKKSGKSRPGRVKKSGASCNGSVTELRKKAKNASGERAKMYHWCANMKSGKKK
jgi:5'(3')-deoxyribonucleotidase